MHSDSAWERNFPLCTTEKNEDAVGYGIMFRGTRWVGEGIRHYYTPGKKEQTGAQ